METQVQQTEYLEPISTTSVPGIEASETGTLAVVQSAKKSESELQDAGKKVSNFFERLPEYIVSFVNEYKLPVISFGLLVAGITTLRIVLAIVDSINDIPLLSPTFELIGISYTTWFVFRYLIKSSTRKELAATLRSTQKEIVGDNISKPVK